MCNNLLSILIPLTSDNRERENFVMFNVDNTMCEHEHFLSSSPLAQSESTSLVDGNNVNFSTSIHTQATTKDVYRLQLHPTEPILDSIYYSHNFFVYALKCVIFPFNVDRTPIQTILMNMLDE